MSDERFRFQFELLDKMSGPAKQAAASVAMLNQAMVQLNQVNISMRANAQANASGLESWVTKLNSAIGVAKAFVGVIQDMGGALAGVTRGFVGAVLEQAKFHSRSSTTLNTLLRHETGGGQREFSAGIRMGRVLPGSTEDVIKQRVALVSGGFRDRGERDRRHALLQDMLALSPDADAGTQERAVRAFSEIRGEGHLSARRLRQVLDLNSGISQEDIFTQIAQGRGLHGSSQQQQDAVQGLMSDKKITQQEFFNALERADTGVTGLALGGFAHKQGTSLPGQLDTLQSTPDTLLQTFFSRQESTMSSGGMSSFGNFLTKTNAFFDEGTASGERVQAALGGAINGVFGALFGDDPTPMLTKLLGIFEQVVPVFVSFIVAIKAIGSGFMATFLPLLGPLVTAFQNLGQNQEFLYLFERFGQLLGGIGALVVWFFGLIILGVPTLLGGFVAVLQTLDGWLADIGTWFYNAGAFIVQGLATGITNGAHWVFDSLSNLGHGALEYFKNIWNLHSPSRVMMDIGGYMGEGLALGIDDSQQRVSEAMGGMFTPTRSISDFSSPGSSSAGAGAGAPSLTVNFHIPETSSSAQEIADAARPMLETAFAELLERMAISAGVG